MARWAEEKQLKALERARMETRHTPIRLFISHALEDREYLGRLEKHLSQMRREQLLDSWHAGMLLPGEERAAVSRARLELAEIVLFLVSADFLDSHQCQEELHRTLERVSEGAATLLPVVLRECDWQATPLSAYQPLSIAGRPLSTLEDRDAAFGEITKAIRLLATRGSSVNSESAVKSILESGRELIAIGPDVIAWGHVRGADGSTWSVHLDEPFLLGHSGSLSGFTDAFRNYPEDERYVAAAAHGGRLLSDPPRWHRGPNGILVDLHVNALGARTSAHSLPKDMKIQLDPLPMDMTFETVSGVEAIRQRITLILCASKGGWGIGSEYGSRIAELHERLGSDLLEPIIALELVRLATVPHVDTLLKRTDILLSFIERVRSVQVLSLAEFPIPPDDPGMIRVRLVLDINGIKAPWTGDVNVSLSTTFLGPKPDWIAPHIQPS